MNISCFYRFCAKGAIIPVILILSFSSVMGQEIDANVTVDRSQINRTSLNFLDNLAQQLETYINEYDWVTPNFRKEERIGVDIQITLMSVDDNFNFEAQLVIRSRRPIYNSIQETALFFFNDENWTFNYTPNRSLVHDDLQFDDLTSVIDFYAYVILGYDFDSFERLGGTPYFSDAQNVVSLAQTASSSGWSRTGNNRRNRAQLVADLLSTNYELYRTAIYQYHRLGLDTFIDNPEQSRQQVIAALTNIQEAQRSTSNNLLFDIFFNAKYRELVSIFEDADPQVRLEAFNLLSQIDQSHLSEYRKLQ
ncbi:MAG: DUF4835 family protein [Balneolaceae bacterium]